MRDSGTQKGRGASFNPPNRFESRYLEPLDIDLTYEDAAPSVRTMFFRDTSRTILAKNDSPDLPFTYSINPYRGCEHGCIYCYARPSHEYLGFSAGLDFESKIMVKMNAPELLAETFSKKSWVPQMVAFSGNTDCYQPVERHLRLTRRCLEVIADAGNRCTVLTKGTLVVRDLDVLKQMVGRVTVLFSFTTLDEALASQLEPGAPLGRSRLRAMERLSTSGIRVGALVCPVLPGITDSPKDLEAVIRACAESGAAELWVGSLRLSPLVRAHFLPILDRQFPRLSATYRRLYADGADPARAYRVQLAQRAEALRLACGIPDHPAEQPAQPEPEQLALPLADLLR